MDGILNFDKHAGISSTKALYRVRRITGIRKSGHAGTLDPAATGVLLLCLGKATRLVERLMDQPKVYRATARLDITSDSFDSEGVVTPVDVPAAPSAEQVRAAVSAQEGLISQAPPMLSAVKIAGRPAYKLARRGETVELRARPVRVYWIHVHAFGWPELDFEMACGRGTYVRSVIRDLGLTLGCGGCLTSLRRTRIGPFAIEQAATLPQLEAGDWRAAVTPLERCLELLATPAEPPGRP